MAEKIRVFRGGTELQVGRVKLIKTDDQVVDTAVVTIVKDTSVAIGNILDFRKADGTTSVFTAKIIDKTQEGLWTLTCKTNGYELNNIHLTKFYENTTPEAIVQDIIDNFSVNLTYTSTEVSGITLTKYIAKGYLIDIIKDMMFINQWQLRIDESDNAYFEPKGNIDNGYTLTNGDNFQIIQWKEDNTDQFNHVRIVGGIVNVQGAQESFNGDGIVTEFTLAAKPTADVNVTVGGARKIPGIDGTGDYDIDEENSKIVFVVAPVTGTNNVVIDYTYQLRVVVDDQNDVSIAAYGEIFQEIPAPYITSFTDARKMAKGLLSEYSDPLLKPSGFVPYLDFNREVGEIITVTDSQRSITVQRVVRKVIHDYSTYKTHLEFVRRNYDIVDTDEEIKDRIKKLERRTTDDETTAQSRISKHTLNVDLTPYVSPKWVCLGNSFILGHLSLSRLRSSFDYEADCSDSSHPGTWSGSGIGGSQFISNGYGPTIFSVSGAGEFNGSDRIITATDHADLDLSSDFTIMFALRVETLPGAETYIMNKWDGTDGWAVRINASNQVELIYSNAGSDSTLSASTALTAKAWQYITFVKNGTALSVYINGTSDNTGVGGASAGTNTNAFEVGRYSANYLTGYVDELRLYSDNVSTTIISAVTDRTYDAFSTSDATLTNCVLWWSMDNPVLGNNLSRKHTIASNAFIEVFDSTDFKDSPTTADWNNSLRKLRMATSDNHMVAYNTIASSKVYGCGGRSWNAVQVDAVEEKWGGDIIQYFLSVDNGSNWVECINGQSTTITNVGNQPLFKVIFAGNGGSATYLDEVKITPTYV